MVIFLAPFEIGKQRIGVKNKKVNSFRHFYTFKALFCRSLKETKDKNSVSGKEKSRIIITIVVIVNMTIIITSIHDCQEPPSNTGEVGQQS